MPVTGIDSTKWKFQNWNKLALKRCLDRAITVAVLFLNVRGTRETNVGSKVKTLNLELGYFSMYVHSNSMIRASIYSAKNLSKTGFKVSILQLYTVLFISTWHKHVKKTVGFTFTFLIECKCQLINASQCSCKIFCNCIFPKIIPLFLCHPVTRHI